MGGVKFFFAACLAGLVAAQFDISNEVPHFIKSKYGSQIGMSPSLSPFYGGGVKTIGKGRMGPYPTSGTFPGPSPRFKFRGGCTTQPPTPMNAGIRCSQYSGCKADCVPNYQFPNGLTQLFIMCKDGKWETEGTDWLTVPSCEPICLPPCQNQGMCVAPNQCNCPDSFSGPQCQFENKPCLNYPPLSMNSRRTCNSKMCTITCMTGYQFSDGSSITRMNCKDGYWVPAKETWSTVPDCQATCNPPCLNGGNCLSFDVCQCPRDFRGPQCQYQVDSCSVRKLQFNGGYNCSGDAEAFRCSLSCPEGVRFEFPPERVYTCTYSTGTFAPTPIPQCAFFDNVQVVPVGAYLTNSSGVTFSPPQHNSVFELPWTNPGINEPDFDFRKPDQFVEATRPQPGVCFSWGGSHYRTFDGAIFSFEANCAYTLARDAADNTFSVVIKNAKECFTAPDNCHKVIRIYLQNTQMVLRLSDEGTPMFSANNKLMPIPTHLPGLRIEMSAHYVVVSMDSIGAKIKWDGQHLIQLEVQESLWNRTEGLCGRIDGNAKNDVLTRDGIKPKSVTTLALRWKVEDLEDQCNELPVEEHACKDSGVKGSKSQKAEMVCYKLIRDPRFRPCRKVMDLNAILDACKWDYCACKKEDPTLCACETMDVYMRVCSYTGVPNLAEWRDENTCPMKCTGGRVYKSCGPAKGQPVCGALSEKIDDEEGCIEGCYCPEGTVLHENKCITKDECPCRLRGKSYPPGSQVPKDCNTCACTDGLWVCTQVACGARCSAVGDPHYTTFDGKTYDFMGQCSYYLVRTATFSVEAENVACAGSISEAMNLPSVVTSELPSCTKTVTINIAGQIIKLKQNHDVVVNGQDVTKIPYNIANVKIRAVSSIVLQVLLPNGVQIYWDGLTRVYIDLPPMFEEKTKGLCGTFNFNQKDDFLTPQGDVEQAVIPFANKWKTSEKCSDLPNKLVSHPCSINIHKEPSAKKHCQVLKSDLFADCHSIVDPESFHMDCLYDMCSCVFKTSKCLCATLAAYAGECARSGVKIDWRKQVRECGVHCPSGQSYQVCGNSCTRTCGDIASNPNCVPTCVEGCNCPEGESLDDDGECVPIGRCKCQHDGIEFYPGYKEIRPASRGYKLCTCFNAVWDCRLATAEEVEQYPKAEDVKSRCNVTNNMEFTSCEPAEPVTCTNMHSRENFSASVCHAGCKCKEDYVLDSSTLHCVKPIECPCHHGGRSYREGDTVQDDCNTCKCQNAEWKCTTRPCSAECSAWGDGHYKTFDDKHYDFEGQCDYVLSKGSLGSDSFHISIQVVPCGSLGTSCSKSLTVRVKQGEDQDAVVLTKDKPFPKYDTLKHLVVRQKGLFVIIEAVDLGLTVNWDQGTRVYVKVDPRWMDKVKGLCGNYNDNSADDFQTPSGGITEVSAQLFGDSWKLQPYCPESVEVTNTCQDRPDRKTWAVKQCGLLKSSLFAPCHSEVPLDDYLRKCVFDSCACDQGGDCECTCTALAVYAQECNNRGVPIRWRSQRLCPMQCDERCSKYSPCISTCPLETCDNVLIHGKLSRSCQEEPCIEGCEPHPCPEGHIYLNASYLECVPRNICKPVCMQVGDKTYLEGDVLEEDACHTCYCSMKKKICKGQPCPTAGPITEVETTPYPMTSYPTTSYPTTSYPTTSYPTTSYPTTSYPMTSHPTTSHPTASHPTTSHPTTFHPTTPYPTTVVFEKVTECTDGWSSWIKTENIETLPLAMYNSTGAKCSKDQMVDIECRTVMGNLSPKQPGLEVECSLQRGVVCESNLKGRSCPDFEIRVSCRCGGVTGGLETQCNVTQPNVEHPTDCHMFYQCEPGPGGAKYVGKTCGPSMYYNPVTMVCDWSYAVAEIKPECELSREEEPSTENPEVTGCPPDMVFDGCAIQCDHVCLFYSYALKKSGKCLNGEECVPGCVLTKNPLTCPSGMRWMNNETCVAIHDCLCVSVHGKPVKPGTIYHESECRVCQCVDNDYFCDESACLTTQTPSVTIVEVGNATAPTITTTVVSTVTPPKKCDEADFLDLVQGDQPLPDDAFNASSILSPAFKPQKSRFGSKASNGSGGCWSPEFANTHQYLQIDFGRQEPIYGTKIKGSPVYDEYVTSFKVLYSPDGNLFVPVLDDNGFPKIFRGSIDATTAVQQLFVPPFEARVIRISPQTWHNGISLRVELIGCGEPSATTTTPTTYPTETEKPVNCEDLMGLSDGTMSMSQVVVSSELDRTHGKSNLNISGHTPWQPLTNSPTEFVQFDFLEPRIVTGFSTTGGPGGWVTAFVVKYSLDGKSWSTVLDRSTHDDKVFLGNFDSESPQVNRFDLPISTRFVKVVAKKWHENIQLRIEMQGCFEPYPETPVPPETVTTVSPPSCNVCPGIPAEPLELQACRCRVDQWWDGKSCVSRTECPCLEGHVPYPVGTVYEKQDCSECLCKIGGVSHCEPKRCDPCEKGLLSVVTSNCHCTCVPCPDGTTLCSTSNVCINSTSWCNGVEDCPDDEKDCTTTAQPIETTTMESISEEHECPKVECPPGYKLITLTKSKTNKYNLSPMFLNSGVKTNKKVTKKYDAWPKFPSKGGVKGSKLQRPLATPKTNPMVKEAECVEFKCVSKKPPPTFPTDEECPVASCPLGFVPVFEEEEGENWQKCSKHSCHAQPHPDSVCNVTGSTFNTFDGTEYKYDICDHVVARDLIHGQWAVSVKKNCTETCQRQLIIRQEQHFLVLRSDFMVELNGYLYTAEQAGKIVWNIRAFSISRLGDTILFVSNQYGFWVKWNKRGDVQIGVARKLERQVDGLCGYFDGQAQNDKRKPDGTQARTTEEFGKGWARTDPSKCKPQVCPEDYQQRAWKTCNIIKTRLLASCATLVDIQTFISRCVDSTCECLRAAGDNRPAEEQCRCDVLQSFVVDCLTVDPSAELPDWRMQMDCPVTCEPPLVHHDCYQRRCEPTCDSVSDPNSCPKLPHACFPGCYCPPGFVKKDDTCVKPSNCRDCECNLFPTLQYVTFDERNFTVNGDCVYVMSRDVLAHEQDKHKFQVLITDAPCRTNRERVCVGEVTILYENHKMHVLADAHRNNLRLVVDGKKIEKFAELSPWALVEKTAIGHLKILLSGALVEVSVYYPSLGVTIKAPSHKYRGQMEGLCGDCNGNPDDDPKTPSGEAIKDPEDFGVNWVHERPPDQDKDVCRNQATEECQALPPDQDPCTKLLDEIKFGQCLLVLHPDMFLEWCRKDTCGGHPEHACSAAEAFARECADAGFCVHWRNDLCPAKPCSEGKIYDACGTNCSKTCQNIKEDNEKPCKKVPVEGCFCPKGKVLRNDTCVAEADCEVCDDEGHRPGDEWKKDKCTTCTCTATTVECDTQHCPAVDTICEKGYVPVKNPTPEDQCCDVYTCVPEPTEGPTCEPPKELACGSNQVLKLETKASGCQQFICECKPVEECEPLTTESPLEEGVVAEKDDNGCCPELKLICKPELCSEPEPCPPYYLLKDETVPGKCCPKRTCQPPKDKCIYEYGFTAADEGGERPRNEFEKQTILKEANETWTDGPCRQCKCMRIANGNYLPVCTETECPSIDASQDFPHYDLKEVPVSDQCCPDAVRVACKFDSKTYQVGKKWHKGDDFCAVYECVNTTSGVKKETTVESCKADCDPGFKYVPPESASRQCCGSCKPYACMVGGVEHKIDDDWHSEDNCDHYFCLIVNGSVQIQSVTTKCPEPPKDLTDNFAFEAVPVEGQCCEEYNITACKSDGIVHQVGDTWPSPDGDNCKNFSCTRTPIGDIVKHELIETCKSDCGLGWEYRDSNTTCCGRCQQVACVVDGKLKRPGEIWTSSDGCTNFTCEDFIDQLVVSGEQETCPSIEDCPKENVYVKGCCQYCNKTAEPQLTCAAEAMAVNKTIGIITARRGLHGECTNKKPLDRFTECVGACHSSTSFNAKTGSHESDCKCCQATKYESLEIELVCEDGFVWKKKVGVPSSCGCEGCAKSKWLTKS